MKIKNIHRIAILSVLLGLFLVNVAWAMPFEPRWSGVLNCSGFYDRGLAPDGAKPPCTSICDLYSLLQNIINITYTYIVFMAIPFWFVYAGVKYILSGANPGYKKEAQTAMKNAVTGFVLALSAYAIVNSFFYFLSPAGVPKEWGKMTCQVAPTKWREQVALDRTPVQFGDLIKATPTASGTGPSCRSLRCPDNSFKCETTTGSDGKPYSECIKFCGSTKGWCSDGQYCVSYGSSWQCKSPSDMPCGASNYCPKGYACDVSTFGTSYCGVRCNDGSICTKGSRCHESDDHTYMCL